LKLVWTLEALADRRAIYNYIEPDNPTAALRLDKVFSDKIAPLARYPELRKPGRVTDTRELVVHRSYVVIYDIANGGIRILRILPTARQ
jgi:addiction module RelE/StbE family toxin